MLIHTSQPEIQHLYRIVCDTVFKVTIDEQSPDTMLKTLSLSCICPINCDGVSLASPYPSH